MHGLRPIFSAFLLVGLLCLAGPASARIQILLSHPTPPYRALANSIGAYIGEHSLSIIEDLNSKNLPPPDGKTLNISIGSRAMDFALREMPDTPLLVALVPSNAYEDLLKTHAATIRDGKVSAVFPDQPLKRQVAFVRLLMPSKKKMGVLVGQHSFQYVKPLGRLASAQGLTLKVGDARENRIPDAIKDMLSDSDFVLALHDSSLLTPSHAKWLLYMAYQRRIPVIGYSKTYVKAGALAALYTSNDQIARQVSSMLKRSGFQSEQRLAGLRLPAPEYPSDFSIELNSNVAYSFALWGIDPDAIAEKLRRETGEEIRP